MILFPKKCWEVLQGGHFCENGAQWVSLHTSGLLFDAQRLIDHQMLAIRTEALPLLLKNL